MLSLLFALAGAAPVSDFVGPYELDQWSATPMPQGAAAVDLAASSTTEGVFTYEVDLGGGGVSYREAVFEVVAAGTGTAAMTIRHELNHAWFQAGATLAVFAVDAQGETTWRVLVDEPTSGETVFEARVDDLPITAGLPFGVVVGGENFDSNSFLNGTVRLTEFEAAVDGEVDCNGVVDGPARLDECGTCDADPDNDCVEDCAGEWGGTAKVDGCGVCSGGSTGVAVNDCEGPVLSGDTGFDSRTEGLEVACACMSSGGSPAPVLPILVVGGLVLARRKG